MALAARSVLYPFFFWVWVKILEPLMLWTWALLFTLLNQNGKPHTTYDCDFLIETISSLKGVSDHEIGNFKLFRKWASNQDNRVEKIVQSKWKSRCLCVDMNQKIQPLGLALFSNFPLPSFVCHSTMEILKRFILTKQPMLTTSPTSTLF